MFDLTAEVSKMSVANEADVNFLASFLIKKITEVNNTIEFAKQFADENCLRNILKAYLCAKNALKASNGNLVVVINQITFKSTMVQNFCTNVDDKLQLSLLNLNILSLNFMCQLYGSNVLRKMAAKKHTQTLKSFLTTEIVSDPILLEKVLYVFRGEKLANPASDSRLSTIVLSQDEQAVYNDLLQYARILFCEFKQKTHLSPCMSVVHSFLVGPDCYLQPFVKSLTASYDKVVAARLPLVVTGVPIAEVARKRIKYLQNS